MSISSFLVRLVTFSTIVIVWYFGFLWIAIPLSLWYLYNYKAYELIVLGICIDIQFLVTSAIPLYTIGFVVAIVAMTILKPRLRRNVFI